MYDSNSDGEVTRGEFTDAVDLTQEDGRELFEIIDTNSDQKITCDEFKQATRDVADGEPSCDWSACLWIEEPDIIVLCHLLCGSTNLSNVVQHVTLVYTAVLT